MVFSNINPSRDSYRLWHRFSMPKIHGPNDAVAVKASVGEELNSAYTFLLEHVVVLVWTLIVYFGVLASIRRYEKKHPDSSIAKDLFAGRSSPFEVVKFTFERVIKPGYSRWLIFLWLLLALAFFVLKYAIPIIFAKYIIIGNAAPVNPQAIYVPSLNAINTDNDPRRLLDYYALEVPSVLRATGSVESVNSTVDRNSSVSVHQPEPLPPDPATRDPSQRINYGYNITGEDLGLQHYPDLSLNVEGSCFTDYSWYIGGRLLDNSGTVYDTYALYNNQSNNITVSLNDGLSPVATFLIGTSPATGPPSNITWAAIISSVNRTSYFPSTDPWYLTTSNDVPDPPFRVKEGRPALSCWQNDVWYYKEANSSVTHLDSTALPGLQLADPIQKILAHFLGQPKAPYLGTRLGNSALISASTSLARIFNASSSTLHSELERLVFASYIGTVNTLTETTLFPSSRGVLNDIIVNGDIPDGVDGFVIYSKDVVALSVKALIVIPVIAAALWILTVVVIVLPVAEMKALAKREEAASIGKDRKGTGEQGAEESRTETVIGKAVEQVVDAATSP